MHKVFRFGESGKLVIAESALVQMERFRQFRDRDTEAGGVLLGRHLLDSRDLVVDTITTPQKEDRRTRTSFYRSTAHNTLAKKLWEQSGGHLGHLGLWHTHPESDPSPSTIDLNDWKQSVANDSYEGEHLFFVIVGTLHTRVWTKMQNTETLELEEIGRGIGPASDHP